MLHRFSRDAGEFRSDSQSLANQDCPHKRLHTGSRTSQRVAGGTTQGADANSARVWALAAYEEFLPLWKDAASDILILRQAKAEYAQLQ
jgi:hypothetical protein